MLNPKTKEIAAIQRIERGYWTGEEHSKIIWGLASDLFPEITKLLTPMELELFNKRLAEKVS